MRIQPHCLNCDYLSRSSRLQRASIWALSKSYSPDQNLAIVQCRLIDRLAFPISFHKGCHQICRLKHLMYFVFAQFRVFSEALTKVFSCETLHVYLRNSCIQHSSLSMAFSMVLYVYLKLLVEADLFKKNQLFFNLKFRKYQVLDQH